MRSTAASDAVRDHVRAQSCGCKRRNEGARDTEVGPLPRIRWERMFGGERHAWKRPRREGCRHPIAFANAQRHTDALSTTVQISRSGSRWPLRSFGGAVALRMGRENRALGSRSRSGSRDTCTTIRAGLDGPTVRFVCQIKRCPTITRQDDADNVARLPFPAGGMGYAREGWDMREMRSEKLKSSPSVRER
jgi:hypothetical protein